MADSYVKSRRISFCVPCQAEALVAHRGQAKRCSVYLVDDAGDFPQKISRRRWVTSDKQDELNEVRELPIIQFYMTERLVSGFSSGYATQHR